jgi:cytidylate kinase
MIPLANQAGNVIISGLTAAGKTTHAGLLARRYNLDYLSASQTMLKLAGLSIRQPPDFWVTEEGLGLGRKITWSQVDAEIRRVEEQGRHTIFDSLSLPWLCRQKCLVIWLESSLPSRVMKAIVSHRGQNNLTPAEVKEKISLKDWSARAKVLKQYGIDIFRDRSPFNLIIDVTRFISVPTAASARMGIKQVDDIISSAVGWYLYRDRYERKRFQAYLNIYGRRVIQRYPGMDTLPGVGNTVDPIKVRREALLLAYKPIAPPT